MDKYVFLVFLLAPGFIARGVAICLGDFPRKKNEIDAVMSYFSYSFFALLITFLVAPMFGIYRFDEPISDVIAHLMISGIATEFSCIALVVSVLVGAIWPVLVRGLLLDFCNRILKRLKRNEIYLNDSMYEKLFADGKSHFVVLEKDGVEQAVGFVKCVNATDSSKKEFAITVGKNYKGWYEHAKDNEEHPLHYPKIIYFDFEEGIVIKEYNYPSDWKDD